MPPQRREHRQGRQAHHPGIRRRDNLPGQGIRIVRLQACNADGCSGPATPSTPAIIITLGHAAVRVWHTDDALEADWDQIPAIRVVVYHLSADHAEWKTSPVLTEPGYSLSIYDLVDFAGVGHPIIRVYFHCNAASERRVSLGRYPTNTSDEPTRFTDPPPPPARPPRATRHGPTEISDPGARVLRLASDFTITSETQPGRDQPFRRVARPSENRWETQRHGETVKNCS